MAIWNLRRITTGYIYIFESNGRYKIDKTRRTRDHLRATKTELHDVTDHVQPL